MSILSSVTTEHRPTPPRVILYGTGGIGKTTWASNAPAPIMIRSENGIGNLKIPAFPVATAYEQIHNQLIALLDEPHEYKSVIIDSLDHTEPLIWDAVCRLNGKKTIEEFGYGKGYNEALAFWRQMYALLSRINTERGMAIILLAHHEVKSYNDPANDPYDRYQIKLHKAASALAQEWADCILFATYRVVTDDSGARTRGIGCGERCVYTEERPSHVAKNRWSLPYELPLDWVSFQEALKQSRANAQKGNP